MNLDGVPSPPASVDDSESEEENHRLVNGGKVGRRRSRV